MDAWFSFDEMTGRLEPAPELDRRTRARVRLTIRVFQLNWTERCKERQRLVRPLDNALRVRDVEYLRAAADGGAYRFVTRKLLLANRKRIAAAI